MKRTLVGLAMTAALATASSARADIIYFFNNPAGYQAQLNALAITDVNVLFNGAGTVAGPASPVTGRTNVGGDFVNFTSNENLVTPASGQARVEANDGAFSLLTILPQVATDRFGAISFNLNPVNPGGPPLNGTVTFLLTGTVGNQPAPQSVPSNGLFFFGAIAINAQRIASVQISSPNLPI